MLSKPIQNYIRRCQISQLQVSVEMLSSPQWRPHQRDFRPHPNILTLPEEQLKVSTRELLYQLGEGWTLRGVRIPAVNTTQTSFILHS